MITGGDHLIGKAITDDFDPQLFSSGQVALGVYGRLHHIYSPSGIERVSY